MFNLPRDEQQQESAIKPVKSFEEITAEVRINELIDNIALVGIQFTIHESFDY